MMEISLDASDWRSPEDFYSALLPRLMAPAWHGRNLNALNDSLRGGVNRLEPPFVVTVRCTHNLSEQMRAFLSDVASVFDDVRDDTQREVAFQFA